MNQSPAQQANRNRQKAVTEVKQLSDRERTRRASAGQEAVCRYCGDTRRHHTYAGRHAFDPSRCPGFEI